MYIFKNTEQNNKKASDFETKSLLYLIGMHKEKDSIETIAIDCFNDVTGIDDKKIKLWDVQSKNHSSLNPKKIGKSLFTLFDNFECTIEFYEYILFVPVLDTKYLIDNKTHCYGCNNIQPKTLVKIKNGLTEEYKRIKKTDINNVSLLNFLNKCQFIQDHNEPSTYIKRLTKFKSNTIKNEDFYQSIFDEIRGVQANKKNSFIEGKSITKIEDVLSFNRHIHTKEIHALIINRFVGGDLFSNGSIPNSFLEVLNNCVDIQEQNDLILECNSNISRSFFDKNNNKKFWLLIEKIIEALNFSSSNKLNEIYASIDGDSLKLPFMNKVSILFLISIIKHGWKN